jgi:AraC-like DNA-binding protein
MEISYLNVSPKLQPFIIGVWAAKDGVAVRNERIVPDGGSCLIFNFGGTVTATRSNGSITTWKSHFFAGAATSYVDLKYEERFEQVGVIFKPFGAFHLMNTPMSEFSDAGYEVDLVNKCKFNQVSDEMANVDSLEQRLTKLCHWLEDSFVGAKRDSFVPAITSLLQQTDEISVNEIANVMGCSQQHIARVFNKHAGISPKKLQRVYRFQKVLQTFQSAPKESLTVTALDHNYFDQPHFNNEIRAFSGYTPAQLMKQNLLPSFRVIR